ncbi:MAG: PAS domain-containing protein [Candidatus Heimdallarchaeota archaeon]|nr:PAS domain-containing protein [Candidatus Heimdallarchaeota archaeon]MDH5646037.1 PAS domain-containing protein [Candidatus Heimdallarchaeota archaeon]
MINKNKSISDRNSFGLNNLDLDLLLQHIPTAIAIFDTKMRYIACSDRYRIENNIENQDIEGKSHYDIFPDIPKKWREVHQRCLAGSSESAIRDVVERKGIKEWITWSVIPWYHADNEIGGIILFTESSTELVTKENELQESKEIFQFAVEAANLGIWDWNIETNEVFFSTQWKKMLGYTNDEISNNYNEWERLVHPDDRNKILSVLNGYLKGESNKYQSEHRLLCKDGSYKWILTSGKVISRNSKGDPIRVMGIHSDINQEAMEKLKKEQSNKMEVIGMLAGGVAHDFNNHLMVIQGYSDLIADQMVHNTSILDNIFKIRETVDKVKKLVTELLTVSSNQIINQQVLSINDVILRSTKTIDDLLTDHIKMKLQLEGKGFIKIDMGQFEQILVNLTLNSLEAMSAEGEILIKTKNITITSDNQQHYQFMNIGDYIELTFSDTGVGMSQEVLDKIFVPFYSTKEGQNRGLGLSTVFGIVNQNKWELVVESTIEKGSTFTFFIPITDERITKTTIMRNPIYSNVGKTTILLVEDNTDVREIISLSLRRKGYEVLEATNGEQALKLFEKNRSSIHVTLTDVMMPVMDGEELALKLLELNFNNIIFMSGFDKQIFSKQRLRDENLIFLSKPLSIKDLHNTIQELISLKSLSN